MSLVVDFEVEGMAEMGKKISKLKEKWPQAFSASLYVLATDVVSTAMKLAPADTGYLRSSRYVERPTFSGADRYEISGGFGASYAVFVHEIWRKYRVGEWKFLATAVKYHQATALTSIARNTVEFASRGIGIDQVPKMHPDHFVDTGRPRGNAQYKAAKEHLSPRERKSAKRKESRRRSRDAERRDRDIVSNQSRIARESVASVRAQREGRRPNRPGRR